MGVAFIAAVTAGNAAKFGEQAFGEAAESRVVAGCPAAQQDGDL
jgi:hypothetical protein